MPAHLTRRALLGVTVVLLLTPVAAPRAHEDIGAAPVKTTGGLVAGTAASVPGVTAVLGIPHAAAPVGPWRWRDPQPAPAWRGVRQATTFGASCMQAQARSRLPWTEEYMTRNQVGEDCLGLNAWTPARRAARPLAVMVWISGGGFNEGSSAVRLGGTPGPMPVATPERRAFLERAMAQ